MLELLFCSLFTLVPDYLYRRYVQGKRIGREITIFSAGYELRYGITACLMLTVLLITIVFYFHPFLRKALFMPAMSARTHDPALKAFADQLIQRGKTPLQAVVAVMRKLLVALHAMFRKGQPFSSEKLRPSLSTSP